MLDDWLSDPNSNTLCGGYYQEPPLLNLPLSGELKLDADQGLFKPEGVSTLEGHVQLFEKDRQIRAERVLIHRDPKRAKPLYCIEAFGDVHIIEPGRRVDGTHAKLMVAEEEQTVDNAAYRLYEQHGRGEAAQLSVYHKNFMHLDKASYSICAPCENTWTLKAKSIDLNQETGRGQAYHSKLYVKDFPIFYLPYFDFPIDDRRKTGFLYPAIGHSSGSGMVLSAPFYWNIAPNYDATLTPRFFSERGAGLQGLGRYLQPYSKGEIEGFWLPNDKAYQTFRTQKRANHPGITATDPRLKALERGNNRGTLRLNHQITPNPHLQSNIRYHRVHDDNDLMDFGDSLGMASTTQLLQEADLNYQQPQWSVQTRLQQYQTLHPFDAPLNQAVYKRLPQITLNNQNDDLPLGLAWKLHGDFTHFAHVPDPQTHLAFTTGDRLHLRPSLSLPLRRPWGKLTPKIQWNTLSYHLHPGPNNPTQNARAHLDLPLFSVDSRLFFDRSFAFNQETYRQSLEPRAYYVRVPYRNQQGLPNFDTGYAGFSVNQLYWDNRFTGLDRVGDTDQLTLGVGTGFFPSSTGMEKYHLGIGQIHYFKERRVRSYYGTGNDPESTFSATKARHSSLVGEARYQIEDAWLATADTEWNPIQKHSDQTSFYLQYHPHPEEVFNLGYQFLRASPWVINAETGKTQSLRQTDTSLAWPLNPRWRLLGRWHYDIDRKRSNDFAFGIEQQGCCMAVRLLATRFLKPFDPNRPPSKAYTNAIFVQWVFKGLGAFGDNAMHSTLKRTIPDYRPWSDRHF